MIHFVKGDIFLTQADAIVIPVNTVGIMGKGLALAAKEKNMRMFNAYCQACREWRLVMGRIMYYKDETDSKTWVLFPTKLHYKNPSKLEYIEMGLKKFCEGYQKYGITSIAFPKLGCGLGGLRWEDVKPLMVNYLKYLNLTVYIYE